MYDRLGFELLASIYTGSHGGLAEADDLPEALGPDHQGCTVLVSVATVVQYLLGQQSTACDIIA